MKVKDFPYKRYTVEEAEAITNECIEKVKNAKNVDEIIEAHERSLDALGHFWTMGSLAQMRNSLNSFDEFYDKERKYYDSCAPLMSEVSNNFGKAMLSSPFRSELNKRISPRVIKKYEILAATSDPRIIEDEQKEAEIVAEYAKLMAEAEFNYDGKEMPLSVLRGYLSDGDRNVRAAACKAIGEGLGRHRAELDDIYDRLVHVRDKMAKKLGFKNFIELGYLNMLRMDYDRGMVENFRKSVLNNLVPVVSKIKAEVQSNLGIDKFMFYDDSVCFNDGEPKPIIGKEQIFVEAQKMYDAMSKETGDLMRRMLEAEAFDVDARKGKWGGGYCTSFEDFKQAFILANFNGSSGDIDTLTHEFGHAFAADYSMRHGDRVLGVGAMETAECHSMSMEFFAWPYMDKFFGSETNKYKYEHLLSSLSFIPYGTIVDEFQHIVYENPDLTPAERNAEYLKLEKKYRPYLSYEGIPYLEEGTRWQYQMHIYETPFYYIDYCLAQTVALNFLVESRKDYSRAFKKYVEFVKAGGTVPFGELCVRAGFASPFDVDALKSIAEKIPALLKEIRR